MQPWIYLFNKFMDLQYMSEFIVHLCSMRDNAHEQMPSPQEATQLHSGRYCFKWQIPKSCIQRDWKNNKLPKQLWCWLFMPWNILLWADDDKLPGLKSQEAGPRTRENGFQYVSASGQRTSTVPVTERLTWGNCHKEMKYFYCFHPVYKLPYRLQTKR